MRSFFVLGLLLLLCSCTAKKAIKLPTTRILPSTYFLAERYYRGTGANFFNDEENFERLLAAKRMGITWIRLTPSKWKSAQGGQPGTFLVGAREKYRGLIQEDLDKLLNVLDWAYELDLKVALTFLTVPGRVFAQHNGGVQDKRLWSSFAQQEEALQFFYDVALYVGHHPALLALNPINEPAPEIAEPRFTDWYGGDYEQWYETIEGTPQDLNLFYQRAVARIRRARNRLPIMLDVGLFAHPWAFKILHPVQDANIYYSFHWYMPFSFSGKDASFSYPGPAKIDEDVSNETIMWDQQTLNKFLEPVRNWTRDHGVDNNRIVVGEFGVNRLMHGAKNYLKDSRALFLSEGYLHAFYSFREPHFPRMDYELASRTTIYPYWQALEHGVTPNYALLTHGDFLDALGLSMPTIKQPLRGFSTLNWSSSHLNQQDILDMMDAPRARALLAKGFDTVMIDGDWLAPKLLEDGTLSADAKRFPSGIKSLADEAHARGFKLGLSIPIGTQSCAGNAQGSFGHENINAQRVREWGIDIVKLDQCLLDGSEEWPRDLLRATFYDWESKLGDANIEIIANAAYFNPWYPGAASYGKTTLDLRAKNDDGARFVEPFVGNKASVVVAAKRNSLWAHENTEYYLNDPGVILLDHGLSRAEEKSHFAMWIMMNAPLLLSNDPRGMNDELMSLVTKDEILALHDDNYETGRLILDERDLLVFRKRLQHGKTALLFVSLKDRGDVSRSFTFQQFDLIPPKKLRSVFLNKEMRVTKKLTITLKPHDSELVMLD